MRLTSKILKKFEAAEDKLDEFSRTQVETLKVELSYLISKHRVVKLIKESVFPANSKYSTEQNRSITDLLRDQT
jgi:hypothetical protein